MNGFDELVSRLTLPDEEGFIFLDTSSRPYWCRDWGGEPWLFYWHCDKKWVSLRKVTPNDLVRFPRNLSEKEQKYYRDAHRAWEESTGFIEQVQHD
jgi:hypothetical protein